MCAYTIDAEEYTCASMGSSIPFCSGVGWHTVSFPNFRGQTNYTDAQRELSDFMPLRNGRCSNALVHFLCSVYAPFCDSDYPQFRLKPCRYVCVCV